MRNGVGYVLCTSLVLLAGCNTMYGVEDASSPEQWPWDDVSPESQGIHSEDLTRMIEHIEQNNLDVDSVIIYRNGTIPLEAYFEPYGVNVSHNAKSTSKSVISALVGIALREGYLDSLDQSVLSFFPEYDISDAGKFDITIRDLLTMSSGLDWNENDLNSMYTFFVSRRIVKRVLNLSVVAEAGTTFNYNTGLTHLLSAIITKASGMSTLEFADRFLFEPLDIRNVQWTTDRDGYYVGGSELFLTPRAMMKFGVMYLEGGAYDGVQVVPSEWVAESTGPQVEGTFHGALVEYGYLWWIDISNPLFTYLDGEGDFVAMGVHGQRIFVSPDLDTVVVITADQRDESQCDILIRDFIVPALSSGEDALPANEVAEEHLRAALERVGK